MVNTVLDASFVTNSKALAKVLAPRTGRIHRLMGKNLRAWLRKSAGDWERKMKQRQFVQYRGRTPSKALQSRTGALRGSMRSRPFGAGMNSGRIMFTSSPYARIQELGGTVRGNPLLAIPFSDTLTGSGAKIQAKFETIKSGGQWRLAGGDRSRTFIHRTQSGKLIVAANVGGELKGLKILKRSVTIPKGRLGFLRTWRGLKNDRARDRRAAVLAALQGKEWKR